MPALADQPNVLAVRTTWAQSEGDLLTTKQYFTYTGTAPSNATCIAIATAIRGAAVTDLIPLLSSACAMAQVTVTDLTSPTSGFGEYATETSGSRSGAILPASTCALLSCKVERRYRGGKPRVYFPFGTQPDLQDQQTWNSAFASAFDTGLTNYVAAVKAIVISGTTISQFVNISYYQGFSSVENPVTHRWRNIPTPRAVAIAPDVIIAYGLNLNIGSQRRRNHAI